MSPFDIIELPGHPGLFARRVIVEAWQEAGSPPVNDAGRLYGPQKRAWDAFQNGTGNPADDPDRPDLFDLGHVRFVALDITPTPERVRRLAAAGLVRPFPWESWHWAVPNVRAYPLVKSIPTTSSFGPAADPEPTPIQKRDDDMYMIKAEGQGTGLVAGGHFKSLTPSAEQAWTKVLGPAQQVEPWEFFEMRASAVWSEPEYTPAATTPAESRALIAADTAAALAKR